MAAPARQGPLDRLLARPVHARRPTPAAKVAGVDEATVDAARAKAALDRYREKLIESCADLPPKGWPPPPPGTAYDPETSAKLMAAWDRIHASDLKGYNDARAAVEKMEKYARENYPAAEPYITIGFAIAKGMMWAMKAIGLEHFRPGRTKGAFTQEWVDAAVATVERLNEQGIPVFMFDQGQHVSPKEYVQAIEGQLVQHIVALPEADNRTFNRSAALVAKWTRLDPLVAEDFVLASKPNAGWAFYARKLGERSRLSMPEHEAPPSLIVDMVSLVAMRENVASPIYFCKIRDAASAGWDRGIEACYAKHGDRGQAGCGPMAWVAAWNGAEATAKLVTGTGRNESPPPPRRTPLILGALGTGAAFLAGLSGAALFLPLGIGVLVALGRRRPAPRDEPFVVRATATPAARAAGLASQIEIACGRHRGGS